MLLALLLSIVAARTGHATELAALPSVTIHGPVSKMSEYSFPDNDIEILAGAAKDHGACFVHVVDADFKFVDWSKAAANLFAADDLSEASYVRDNGVFRRGYVPPLGESGNASLYEIKEGFSYGHQWASETEPLAHNALTGQNVWPKSLAKEDKAALMAWYDACNKISMVIVRAIAKILGLQEHALDKYFLKSAHEVSLARLFKYFGRDSKRYASLCPHDGPTCTGSSPHTDWGFLTLVAQRTDASEEGLLQFWNSTTSEWNSITFEADDAPGQSTFLVNFGDYLSLLSNGKFASARHRVTLPKGSSSRLSAVFFYYPDYDAAIPSHSSHPSHASLSLLQDQANARGESCPGDKADGECCEVTAADTFGAFIAQKWASVTKT